MDHRLQGGFRYCSIDDDTGEKLYNREIQDTRNDRILEPSIQRNVEEVS